MVKLYDGGVYLVNGTEIVEDNHDAEAILKQKMAIHASSILPKKWGLS